MRHPRLLPIALVSLLVGCGEAPTPDATSEAAPEAASEDIQDSVIADPDHYSVEFENDAVRLVRIAYGPGEKSVMHSHPANCSVALDDGSWRMTDPEGAVTEEPSALGQVQCGEGYAHLPENLGSEASGVILIEFKEGATVGSGVTSDYGDAVTADPEHYTVEFENDFARLIRIRYGPGETSMMHHHPANCAIFLKDEEGTFERPSGEVEEMPTVENGTVVCQDLEEHLPTNAGDGPLELVIVELKGREAF